MKKIKPHKEKYYNFYIDIAELAAKQSTAKRRQVGAAVVLKTGMIATGWNGTGPGQENVCELSDGTTKPEVIHAERNALDKLTREGVSPEGAILFVTTAPCLECAKSIAGVGIYKVFYKDSYNNDDGIQHLKKRGIEVNKYFRKDNK